MAVAPAKERRLPPVDVSERDKFLWKRDAMRQASGKKLYELKGSSDPVARAALQAECEALFWQQQRQRERQMEEQRLLERLLEEEQRYPAGVALWNRISHSAETTRAYEEGRRALQEKLAALSDAEWQAIPERKRQRLQTVLRGDIEQEEPLSAYEDAIRAGPEAAWAWAEERAAELNRFRIPTRNVSALVGRILSWVLHPR